MKLQKKPTKKVPKLKSAQRDKRRYLLLEKTTNKEIEQTLLKYLGILGFAKIAYKPVKVPEIKRKFIASCLASQLIHVQTALTLEGIKIQKIANTIKGLQK